MRLTNSAEHSYEYVIIHTCSLAVKCYVTAIRVVCSQVVSNYSHYLSACGKYVFHTDTEFVAYSGVTISVSTAVTGRTSVPRCYARIPIKTYTPAVCARPVVRYLCVMSKTKTKRRRTRAIINVRLEYGKFHNECLSLVCV